MIKGQTTNSFSLLSDDEIYRQPSVPKTEPKTAPQTTVAKKVDTNVRKTNKPSTGTKNFVGRKNDNRKPRGDDETSQLPNFQRKPQNRGKKTAPKTRGREFDRHSGTGRPPTENKKGGAGKGGWGDLKSEMTEITTEETNPTTEVTTTTEETVKEEKVVEKEPEYVSFEDFEAQRVEQQKMLEEKYGTKSVRKVDGTWAQGLNVHKKPELSSNQSQEPTKKSQGGRKLVNAADVFTFVTQPTQQRGGKGRFNRTSSTTTTERRKGGKGPQRGPLKQKRLDTTDEKSFPSLGGN